jgi:hypothetical protein
MSADIFQGVMNYLNNVDEAFAFASVSKNLPCEKEAVRNTIMGVAGNLGLDLSGYTVKSVGIVDCNSEIGSDRIRATDSPPQRGGVAAPQRKRTPSEMAQTGWSGPMNVSRMLC